MRPTCSHVLSSLLPAGLLALCLLGGCASNGATVEEKPITHDVTADETRAAKSVVPIATRTAVLYVNGLGCPLCASNIEKQLKRVKGVETIAVDLSVGRVTLGLSEGTRPSPFILGEAVLDAGFTLVKVEAR